MWPSSAPIVLTQICILLMNFDCTVAVATTFTNLQCEPLDPSVVTFQECRLKVIGRGIISYNVYGKLLKLPLNKLVVNMGLYKKANGYKPFLYNTTVDYCKYANKSARNVFLMITLNFLKDFSNVNHTCPINHDLQIKNLVMSEDKFCLMPLPSGEYMLHLLYSTSDKWEAYIKVYFTRIE